MEYFILTVMLINTLYLVVKIKNQNKKLQQTNIKLDMLYHLQQQMHTEIKDTLNARTEFLPNIEEEFLDKSLPEIEIANELDSYVETFLSKHYSGKTRRTYINRSLYDEVFKFLPTGVTIPTFLNNVVAEHLKCQQWNISQLPHKYK